MFDWLDAQTRFWLAVASAAMLVASPLLAGFLLVHMPVDYFVRRQRPVEKRGMSAARIAVKVLKNVTGAVLLLAGIAMLALPGQGVLTMLVALALLDVPGKRALERWLVSRPKVAATINRLRARYGREPLRLPEALPEP